jgi:glycosyltransferase involved in cell wall biosynthesis
MKLALFFTCGVSLKIWVESGLFDREKLIYEEHLKRRNFERVYWITYGSEDREIAQRLQYQKKLHPAIEVIPMPKVFDFKRGSLIYSLMVPFLRRKAFRRSDVLKTNQIHGSWSAVLAKLLYKKPLLVRTGFTKSLNLERQLKLNTESSLKFKNKIKYYQLIERIAYRFCDVAVVASRQNKEYLCKKYHLDRNKVQVIANYVDTHQFKPLDMPRHPNRLIFVGRLTEAKNLFNLIEAVSQKGMILDIYGKGEVEEKLRVHSRKLESRVNFMGVVPNEELPGILNKYKYYVLPSYYENMPKSLLEAMACGLICIGTDVQGINEVIEDGVNGVLAKNTDAASIASAIGRSLHADSASLGKSAVDTVLAFFTLKSAVAKEIVILKSFQNKHIFRPKLEKRDCGF